MIQAKRIEYHEAEEAVRRAERLLLRLLPPCAASEEEICFKDQCLKCIEQRLNIIRNS